MFLIRRTMLFGCSSLIAPRKVYAFDKNKLHEHIIKQNKQDEELVRLENKNSLKKWSPSADYKDIIEKTINDDLLNDLSYMMIMYDIPLKPYQRINASRDLLKLLENTEREDEKEYIISVMKYYGLYFEE